MISPLDSRVYDANAEALGVTALDLMGAAGARLSEFLGEMFPGKSLLFVCGSGNNGGDGFAAALRTDPSRTKVALLCEPSKIRTDAARYYYSVLECPVTQYSSGLLTECDVVVDCALGTGISGEVHGRYAAFIDDANSCGKPVVSADVPSGFGTARPVRPTATVTFVDVKEGMEDEVCGEVVVADIGMPDDAVRMVGPGDMLRYPVPDARSHKGENGRLMVIAGGPYFGAPAMSAYAALRIGTDVVRVFCPEEVRSSVAAASPVLMVTPLPGGELTPASVDALLGDSEGYDAVLVGPGLGTSRATMEAVRMFLSECRRPMVVDADALTAAVGVEFNGDAVLTPHAGEFARLGGGSPEAMAARMHATVLLKGPEDVIADGIRTRVNRTGTPAMTGAGTGDVLAGCVAGLLSKGMAPFDAACLGAYICGRAGEVAFASKSYGLIATDVAEAVPEVLREGLHD